jgi:hypothetical protein
MAKINGSKNEAKKLQKEITALKNKLKVADKKLKGAEKKWQKQHQASQKEMDKKLKSTYIAGYQAGLSESEKKEVARKKALHTAEMAFEKDYRKKSPASKEAKKLTAKGEKAGSAGRVSRGRKQAKAGKSTRRSGASKTMGKLEKAKSTSSRAKTKTASDQSPSKRRGRPPSKQQEKTRIPEAHHLNPHEETHTQHFGGDYQESE